MPELPEVETTRRGIEPYVLGRAITEVVVRERRLRWPVPRTLATALRAQSFSRIDRRAKYLLFRADSGCMILHLGMSGSLRIVRGDNAPEKHDHVDIVFGPEARLRFRDPRRFGSIHWTRRDPLRHRLLSGLGPEPLEETLTGAYLHARSRGRVQSVKSFIMDSRIVVGIGNIYANEALHAAGIHPLRAAGRLAPARYQRLAAAIRRVLNAALARGGTTLRDFVNGEGEPGYFGMELRVYDRAGRSCRRCRTPVRVLRSAQRSTFYCPGCQR